MKSKIYNILLTLVIALAAVACAEDPLYDPSYIGEGEAEVTAEVTFTPLYPSLSRSVTGGTPGDAIKEIENLCIVFYNEKNEYVNHFYYDEPTTADSTDKPDDYNDTNRAEEKTRKATVKIPKLSYGKYHVYAVANVDKELLTDEIVKNIETLKKFELVWNEEKVAANNQMFGYFSANNASTGFEAPEIVINQKSVKLHAWIKRAASKVTVAFDGTGLNKGVEIFIKSVTIKDIPKYCYLGADNPATPSEEGVSGPVKDETEIEIIENSGQVMTFCPDGIDPSSEIPTDSYNPEWPGYVSKGTINGFGADKLDSTVTNKLEALHSETTNAFYFYENLQGLGKEGTPTDKHQQVCQQDKTDGVVSYPGGIDPTNIAWKDAKKYGSYIEVKAYYKSGNEIEGEGEITYRFMLGKDADLDYNAERNHHYKLTLKFKGWANDVDWHIDYRKEPETKLRFRQPFYISYLYGQTAMIPLEFDAPKDVTIEKIEANIIDNHWSPMDCKVVNILDLDRTDYNSIVGSQPPTFWRARFVAFVNTAEIVNGKPWNGFLSLRKPKNLLVLPEPSNLDHNEPSVINKVHYEDANSPLGSRTYYSKELGISKYPLYYAMDKDSAHVSWDNGTYYVKLPIWTRARQLITRTGYTGNNPYDAYYRQAIVNVKIYLSNGVTLDSSIDGLVDNPDDGINNIEVKQVRRLVNPKGIYRRADNPASFHVVLKVLKSDTDTKFSTLESDGAWRAYIIRDSQADEITGEGGFIKLRRSGSATEADYTFEYADEVLTRKSIEGRANTPIDFHIDFEGTASKPRYAIIRVEYNYYSCYHLIFVRQGYDADDAIVEGVKWCTGNNINQSTIATNPLDEGSLFRFGNWTGIKSESNVNKLGTKTSWTAIMPDDFLNNVGNNLKMTDNTTQNWDDIASLNPATNKFATPTGSYRIATLADFAKFVPKDLNNSAEVENFPIKTGYGICYGDGAIETAESIEDAYGHKGSGEDGKGMRGCFVYNTKTGGNLFFPIGSSGYGHRKNRTDNDARGILRYSSNNRWGYFNSVTYTDTEKKNEEGETVTVREASGMYKYGIFDAPLFLDIFRSNGAIYWFDTEYEGKDNDGTTQQFPAWDINYSTFDFAKISHVNVWNDKYGSDACFIRCIQE